MRFKFDLATSTVVTVRVDDETRPEARARRLAGFDRTVAIDEEGVVRAETPERRITRRDVSWELRAARRAVAREVEIADGSTRVERTRAVRSCEAFEVLTEFRLFEAVEPRTRNRSRDCADWRLAIWARAETPLCPAFEGPRMTRLGS